MILNVSGTCLTFKGERTRNVSAQFIGGAWGRGGGGERILYYTRIKI